MTSSSTTLMLAASLAAGLSLPAAQAEDTASGFDRIYEASGQRSESAGKSASRAKAGAIARFGSYGPAGQTHRPAPVHSVIRARRLPDGSVIFECGTEHRAPARPLPITVTTGRREK